MTEPFLATATITITIDGRFLADTDNDGIYDEVAAGADSIVLESVVVTRDGVDYTLDVGGGLSLYSITEGMGDNFVTSDEQPS